MNNVKLKELLAEEEPKRTCRDYCLFARIKRFLFQKRERKRGREGGKEEKKEGGRGLCKYKIVNTSQVLQRKQQLPGRTATSLAVNQ